MASIRHPLLRSKYTLRGYAAGWIPLAILYRYTLVFGAHLSLLESFALTVPLVLMLALVCLFPWYACRALPIATTPAWKAIVGHLVLAMWVSAAIMFVMHLIAWAWTGPLPELGRRFDGGAAALSGTIFLTYLLATALHYAVIAVEASRQAEVLSREAQLKALKSQVNPHFLFNSLNSISALTTVDPAKARDMCVKLSDFLRNSLRLGERISIPLGEELALANNYLDVEQIRFGGRLRVHREFDAGCDGCEVPPLLLQPLVENSIKHGIATLIEGGEIEISGRKWRDALKLVVANPFDPDAPATAKSGFGLINVRNRIQARWGAAAKMDIQVRDNQYQVTLYIPCERGKRA